MKRYIGNTGEVYIVEDDTAADNAVAGRPETLDTATRGDSSGSLLGNLFGGTRSAARRTNLPFGLEVGDIAILALLFFLYRESGDDEFLILLACFAFCLLTK